MGMVVFGQLVSEGATFAELIYSVSTTVVPIVFGLWCAKWIYQILVDIGNGG